MSVNIQLAPIRPSSTGLGNNMVETDPPYAINGGDTISAGMLSVSQLAQGIIANTGIAWGNQQAIHICEPFGGKGTLNTQKTTRIGKARGIVLPNSVPNGAPVLQLQLLLKSSTIQQAIAQVRAAISSALSGLTGTTGPWLEDMAEYVKNILVPLNHYLKLIIFYESNIALWENYVNKTIAWIENLPALLGAALSECLSLLKVGLATALSATVSSGGVVGQIIQSYQLTQTALAGAKQVVSGANQVATNLQNLPTVLQNNTNAAVSSVSNQVKGIQNTFTAPQLNVKVM
jgi:hypothetical protein